MAAIEERGRSKWSILRWIRVSSFHSNRINLKHSICHGFRPVKL
jgi:hypothetical protein